MHAVFIVPAKFLAFKMQLKHKHVGWVGRENLPSQFHFLKVVPISILVSCWNAQSSCCQPSYPLPHWISVSTGSVSPALGAVTDGVGEVIPGDSVSRGCVLHPQQWRTINIGQRSTDKIVQQSENCRTLCWNSLRAFQFSLQQGKKAS